ncbi:hypothetical protein [Methylobacterium sp. Leaf106]|uniref:hypothetical protein n=1 Tax=Methylobacterium sp. Leaf106 TaxID=1736255 RepID=UPI0006FCD490|nr:hypothetical protein [Methylobacterium sp. Leaf106]KQP53047.1 hypothetical protein ASF34_01365 [Methylobacterium sp. Leaf106]
MNIGKVCYQVRPVERHIITRYVEDTEGRPCGSEVKGEFDNAKLAREIARALAKDEAGRLGFPPGDERMQYPERESVAA